MSDSDTINRIDLTNKLYKLAVNYTKTFDLDSNQYPDAQDRSVRMIQLIAVTIKELNNIEK